MGENIITVTADGAYEARCCHKAILIRDAVPIIPSRKNGRLWKPTAQPQLPETKRCEPPGIMAEPPGNDGQYTKPEAASKMPGLKSFGERVVARDPDR